MKLFPALLAASLLVSGPAFAQSRGGGHGRPDTFGDGRGASCERGNASFCGGGSETPETEPPGGGEGGGGPTGGGSTGGGTRAASPRISSPNLLSQRQSQGQTASASNAGNTQSVLVEGDEREVPIAPLPITDSIGGIGDIQIPLPNVGVGAFTSTQSNGELDYGASVGIRVPLGTGFLRDAARAEIEARADRDAFRLIQEAVWLRDNGLLDEEVHPRHYAALYGE